MESGINIDIVLAGMEVQFPLGLHLVPVGPGVQYPPRLLHRLMEVTAHLLMGITLQMMEEFSAQDINQTMQISEINILPQLN